MTFDSAAWAINGPLISASLARRAEYAVARQSGIVQKDDLKVSALTPAGNGLTISSGSGVVINGYQKSEPGGPNEAYVVSNPGTHTITAANMPASNPAAKSYIVAIVIGDPDFSQVGHPWMPSSGVPAGTEQTFQYVRPTLIEVAAGATDLGNVAYPALVLARVDIPANTTTITSSMVKDLRTLQNPRQAQYIYVSADGTWTAASPRKIPAGTAYADWAAQDYKPAVTVPTWAKRAIVVASINGVRLTDSSVNVTGGVRTQLGTVSGPSTPFDIPSGIAGAMRMNLQTAGEYDCTSIAGTTVNVRIEGYEATPASPTPNQTLDLRGGSQVIFDVRFFEQ